jgi:hypothetical protein
VTGSAIHITIAGPFDCQKVRHPATQLLPIYCQYIYADFVSWDWRCNMHYYGRPICLPEVRTLQLKQLLPICCRYIYSNFASEVEGVLCIIIASPFILYPSTYLEKWSLLPIFYIIIMQKATLSVCIYPSTYLEKWSLLPIFYIKIPKKTSFLDV